MKMEPFLERSSDYDPPERGVWDDLEHVFTCSHEWECGPFLERWNHFWLSRSPDWIKRIYWRWWVELKMWIRPRYIWQRWTRGFDNRELWNLDHTILEFVLPRLKAFREMPPHGCPCHPDFVVEEGDYPGDETYDYDKWLDTLDEMIYAIEYLKENDTPFGSDDEYDRVMEGWDAFKEHFFALWD